MTEHEHNHSEHDHAGHAHPEWEVNIKLKGGHPEAAAKVLKNITRLLRDGEVAADGVNIKYGVEWELMVDVSDPNALPHSDFKDGEGNIVHVDEDGVVVLVLKPGAEQPEPVFKDGIKLSDWAENHGGITPWTPDSE